MNKGKTKGNESHIQLMGTVITTLSLKVIVFVRGMLPTSLGRALYQATWCHIPNCISSFYNKNLRNNVIISHISTDKNEIA
jgi:hypothetical protein